MTILIGISIKQATPKLFILLNSFIKISSKFFVKKKHHHALKMYK